MSTVNSNFYIKKDSSKILVTSIEAVKSALRKMYDCEVNILGVTSEDVNRELGRVTKQTKSYPYFNIRPVSIEENKSSYNSFALAKLGCTPIKNSDSYFYGYHLRPVILTCEISYFSQDYSQVLEYQQQLMFNVKEATVKITSQDKYSIRIKMYPEVSNTSLPDKDLDSGNCYEIKNNLIIHTYAGILTKTPELTKPSYSIEFLN
jgi:hypothetical protein